EQMTKKSVKPAAFRRSRTTISSAFLASAARTARSTSAGSLAAFRCFVRFDISALALSALGMQPACRPIRRVFDHTTIFDALLVKSVLLNVLSYSLVNQSADRFTTRAAGSDGS